MRPLGDLAVGGPREAPMKVTPYFRMLDSLSEVTGNRIGRTFARLAPSHLVWVELTVRFPRGKP